MLVLMAWHSPLRQVERQVIAAAELSLLQNHLKPKRLVTISVFYIFHGCLGIPVPFFGFLLNPLFIITFILLPGFKWILFQWTVWHQYLKGLWIKNFDSKCRIGLHENTLCLFLWFLVRIGIRYSRLVSCSDFSVSNRKSGNI